MQGGDEADEDGGEQVHRSDGSLGRVAGSSFARGLRRATRDADQRERAAGVRHRRRRLVEEDQAHHDGDRRDEVGRDAEVAGASCAAARRRRS